MQCIEYDKYKFYSFYLSAKNYTLNFYSIKYYSISFINIALFINTIIATKLPSLLYLYL